MKPIESISNFLRNIQKKLFPNLQEALGPLTEKQQKLVKILEMIRIEEYVGKKPSESGNNTHFQRHSCPGPDFWAEKGIKGIFS